jgi:hypothetical protein
MPVMQPQQQQQQQRQALQQQTQQQKTATQGSGLDKYQSLIWEPVSEEQNM